MGWSEIAFCCLVVFLIAFVLWVTRGAKCRHCGRRTVDPSLNCHRMMFVCGSCGRIQ